MAVVAGVVALLQVEAGVLGRVEALAAKKAVAVAAGVFPMEIPFCFLSGRAERAGHQAKMAAMAMLPFSGTVNLYLYPMHK